MIPKQRRTVAVAVVAVIMLLLFYGMHDPADGMVPQCMVKKLSGGFDCPGCGSQRAIHALLHGDIAGAWRFNAAMFIMLPLAAVYGITELAGIRNRFILRVFYHPYVPVIIAVGITAWWILRNIL